MSKKKKTMKERKKLTVIMKEAIRKIWTGIKFTAGKIWGARHYITAIFIGGLVVLAKGFSLGYKKKADESDEKVDERLELINALSGHDPEKLENIQEAIDLVNDYGADSLREMARFCEEGPPVDD